MSKRLPEPKDGKRQRLILADDELILVERMATDVRLSVASFLRAVVVSTAEDWPKRMANIKATAERIEREAPPDRRKPGRPKNDPAEEPKKGKGSKK